MARYNMLMPGITLTDNHVVMMRFHRMFLPIIFPPLESFDECMRLLGELAESLLEAKDDFTNRRWELETSPDEIHREEPKTIMPEYIKDAFTNSEEWRLT